LRFHRVIETDRPPGKTKPGTRSQRGRAKWKTTMTLLDESADARNEISTETHLNCANCGEAFEPRRHGGGKPQRFCSDKCRLEAHRSQRSPTRNVGTLAGDTEVAATAENASAATPSPTEFRHMLIEATKDFDTKMTETAEEAVDNALASGKVKYPAAEDEFEWTNDDSVLVPDQRALACYFNKRGELVIRQERAWDQDEDNFVFIAERNIAEFLDKLTDICGIPSVGRNG
jgi:hypothetical protein